MMDLGHAKGYGLAHAAVSGTNLFFVRSDLVNARFLEEAEVIRRFTNYHLVAQLHAQATGGREMITPPAGEE